MSIKFFKGSKSNFDKWSKEKQLKTRKVQEIRIDEETGAIYYILEDENENSANILDIDIDFINNLWYNIYIK